MQTSSVAIKDESGIQTDLNRYKQAAELAYRYARTKADEQTKENSSPFDVKNKEEPTNDKETQ